VSRKGIANVKTASAKKNTQELFAEMLTNAAEDELWKRFMASEDEDLAFRAFIKAVEYKRGKPIQPVSGPSGGAIPITVVTNAALPNE